MQVSIFSCLIDKTPKETSLEEIVRIMRSTERLRNLCERRRELIKSGNKFNADLIKRKLLPAFAPDALMYGGKARHNVTGLTDLCFLDIDHISYNEIEESMRLLYNDKHVVLAARSMSGDGLHFLVRYAFQDREQPWIGIMSHVRMISNNQNLML